MAQDTGNTTNLVRQQIYSDTILASYTDFIVNQTLFRDYTSDFPDGDTLHIDQIGDILWKVYSENTDVDYTQIDTSRLTLTVSDYNQDAFYMTDKIKQDSWKSDRLFSERIALSAKRLQVDLQSGLFSTANSSQTVSNANNINSQPHRMAAVSGTFALQDLAKMKLSFDKANVPQNGRILIIDPTVEYTLNSIANLVALDSNPAFQGIVETGFARDNRFVRNIYGFDIWTSNLLPAIASEANLPDRAGANQTITNGVANIAMYVGDEDGMAMMGVMRQTPSPEFIRNPNKKRDEWSVTERHGWGLQRPESLFILLTD